VETQPDLDACPSPFDHCPGSEHLMLFHCQKALLEENLALASSLRFTTEHQKLILSSTATREFTSSLNRDGVSDYRRSSPVITRYASVIFVAPNRVLTSTGQRRAFVQFEHLDNAVAFVDEHYPKLLLPLQDNADAGPDGKIEAYVHFARRREDWDSRPQAAGNWRCPSVC
jgi:hypothetical protein